MGSNNEHGCNAQAATMRVGGDDEGGHDDNKGSDGEGRRDDDGGR